MNATARMIVVMATRDVFCSGRLVGKTSHTGVLQKVHHVNEKWSSQGPCGCHNPVDACVYHAAIPKFYHAAPREAFGANSGGEGG